MQKFSAKVESTKPPPNLKRFDRYLKDINGETGNKVTDIILKNAYYQNFRKPDISARLQDFLLKGIIYDNYNGLRRDEYLQRAYNLESISYGKWVNDEDRFNFLAILSISLYDLSKVLGTENLGKSMLTIDWGGIGVKGAAGVYYRNYKLITMPRYKRPDKYIKFLQDLGMWRDEYITKYFTKIPSTYTRGEMLSLNKAGKAWIMRTAGWGSFAHEYGHFMDNILGNGDFASGRNVLPELSGAFYSSNIKTKKRTFTIYSTDIDKLIGWKPKNKSEEILFDAFYNWLVAMYFIKNKDNSYRPNTQYLRLYNYVTRNNGKWNYWGSIVEIWARSFEVYIAESLKEKNITNTFLVGQNAKFGREIRIVEGKQIVVIDASSAYITGAHVWQNKKVFQNIINIFVSLYK